MRASSERLTAASALEERVMKVSELLQKNVHTTRPEALLKEAAEEMFARDVGALPVVDERNRLVGMITDRDICMCALIEGRPLTELPVSLAMSTPVFTCKPEDTIADVHATMQTHQLHRVPVADADGVLVGIVGWSDLVRATAAKKRGATPTDLLRTLTLVTEPHELAEIEVTAQPARARQPS